MRNWLFWLSIPFLVPQALGVRRRTPRFTGPEGAKSGRVETLGAGGATVRLVGLGDSIIAGVGADHANECLTAQLARELGARRQASVEWHNVGRIGATTTRVLNELSQRLPTDPVDVFLVSVGVNDVTSLRRRGEWSREIRALANLLAAHSPRASILFLGLPPMHLFPALPTPLRQSLGLRAKLFDESLAAALSDHTAAQHVPLKVDTADGMFSADGFHPSPVAYALIANRLADVEMEIAVLGKHPVAISEHGQNQ